MFWCVLHAGYKSNLRVFGTLQQAQRSGHVPCPQSFPTSWHSAGLGINREAHCAPRMHVCRVPISEYTVIGLPEGLYLTFRLQVAGHSTAQPTPPMPLLLTLFLLIYSVQNINRNEARSNHKIWRLCDWKLQKSYWIDYKVRFYQQDHFLRQHREVLEWNWTIWGWEKHFANNIP